jgi:hypothetical protein
VGAVTFGNGVTGISGVVSAANSLIGSTTGDTVGLYDVTAFSNGNYVVSSPAWHLDAGRSGAGAVTFGNGTTGIKGVVSAVNSIVGSTSNAGLQTPIILDDTNNTFYARFLTEGSGKVRVGSQEVLTRVPDAIVGRLTTGQWWAASSSGTPSFTNTNVVNWANQAWTDVMTGDFNGDQRDDLVGRDPSGKWMVSLNQGNNTFAAPTAWGAWLATVAWKDIQTADVNGDGRTDIVGRLQANGQWYVALNQGVNNLVSQVWLTWDKAGTWVDVHALDMNLDGRADIVGRNNTNGQWNVALSNGMNGFTNSVWKTWAYNNVTWVNVVFGDLNHDGLPDVAGRLQSTGGWFAAMNSGGTSFADARALTSWSTAAAWTDVRIADLNGDGYGDLLGRYNNTLWIAAMNSGNANPFNNVLWGTWAAGTYADVLTGDFDGDGKLDVAGRLNGEWWVLRGTGNNFAAAAKWTAWTNIAWQSVQTVRP